MTPEREALELLRKLRMMVEDFRNPCFGSQIHNDIPRKVGLLVIESFALLANNAAPQEVTTTTVQWPPQFPVSTTYDLMQHSVAAPVPSGDKQNELVVVLQAASRDERLADGMLYRRAADRIEQLERELVEARRALAIVTADLDEMVHKP